MIEYLHMLQTISQISLVDIYLPPCCFQCCHVRFFMIMCTAAHQASLSFTVSQSLLKHMSIESVMPSYHLILCCPLPLLPSVSLSIRVFSSESVLHIRWPKDWSFSISPSNEYSGLISFRIHWLDLLCCPRDSHESSPAPQFKSINSLALSLLSSPTLTYLHDYWKNDSFDYMDFFFFFAEPRLFLICCLCLS